jgi:hypothetical protein
MGIATKHTKQAINKDTDLSICGWVDLISSASHCKRSSVQFTIQAFDPAFSISELLPEIFYLLMVPRLALSEMQKLIDALYRCTELQKAID